MPSGIDFMNENICSSALDIAVLFRKGFHDIVVMIISEDAIFSDLAPQNCFLVYCLRLYMVSCIIGSGYIMYV